MRCISYRLARTACVVLRSVQQTLFQQLTKAFCGDDAASQARLLPSLLTVYEQWRKPTLDNLIFLSALAELVAANLATWNGNARR